MVWWRGLGGLGFIFAVIGGFAGAGVGTALNAALTPFIGAGIVLGGAAAFALGWYLNVARPMKQTEEWSEGRRQALDHQVATGQFRYNLETPPPSSLAEARSQADSLLAWERERAHKAYRNNHSIYSIPLQWFGVAIAVIGLIIAGFGIAAMVVP